MAIIEKRDVKPIKSIRAFNEMWRELILALDAQTLFALVLVGLGVAIAGAPEAGAAGVLNSWGISPKGYGLVLAFTGTLVIRFGKYRIFAFLTLPYVIYIIALIQYAMQTTNSFAPVVVYIGSYLLALRLVAQEYNHSAAPSSMDKQIAGVIDGVR